MNIAEFTLVAEAVSRRIAAGESLDGGLREEWQLACREHRDWIEANLVDTAWPRK